ncbi:MAG: PD-(D/E)XK nuclease family protein, partial [Prevotella sp.]
MDDVAYLTPEQKEMIKTFFSNFSDDHNSELKRRFLDMWSRLYDIYKSFNTMLDGQGLAYEGALYRSVVEDESVTFGYDTYIFVGFNMLQKVEQRLFYRLKKEGKARFYWDFDDYYMPDGRKRHGLNAGTQHEAGHYIAAYLEDFPNELDIDDGNIYDNFSRHKDISFISASTENIQAGYVNRWLKEKGRAACGRRTAVVMCDEGLLTSVIHYLPEEVDKVNITTGWQLSLSPMASLLTLLIELQTDGCRAQAGKYRLQSVNRILRHPYMKYISAAYGQLYDELNVSSRVYYPSRDQLAIDDGTALLFTDIYAYESATPTGKIVKWLIGMVKLVASNAGGSDDQLFKEAVFRCFTLLNRLENLIESGDLTVDIATLQRLLKQLISSTAIPFHGEPAEGIQVMGVLETRNIDFDHVLLLSANEGKMPKGVNDTSLIPYSIRKAHELTTIDNKVAIFAYYFYRLLQRAADITIVYNSSTTEGSTGEMSRFMLQMLVESGHHISRMSLAAGQEPKVFAPTTVEKTTTMVTKLRKRFEMNDSDDKLKPLLTPTAINRYMRCPKIFYFNYICNIWEPDDNDNEEIDNRLFGTIFHDSAQLLYEQLTAKGPHIQKSDMEWLLKHDAEIARAVDTVFCKELFHIEPGSGTKPEYNGLQLINREVIITY